MSKELYISATPHETKVAIVEEDQLTEVYYERENEYTLAGSIYKGRVTRVLPGMQSAFVDVGLERDAFLYVTDFMEEQEDEEYVVTQAPATLPDSENRRPPREQPPRDQNFREAASRETEAATSEFELEAGRQEEGERALSGEAEAGSGSSGQHSSGQHGEERGNVRRWRGRRGRRRGRGGEFREGQREGTGSAAAESAEPADAGHPVRQFEPEAEVPQPRTPAVMAPETKPASNKFVLPGESISKYQPHERRPEHEGRGASEHQERAARPVSAFRPSTEVTALPVGGWVGGSTLPGESISKYRRSGAPAPSAPPQGDPGFPPHFAAAIEEPGSLASVEHIEQLAPPGPAKPEGDYGQRPPQAPMEQGIIAHEVEPETGFAARAAHIEEIEEEEELVEEEEIAIGGASSGAQETRAAQPANVPGVYEAHPTPLSGDWRETAERESTEYVEASEVRAPQPSGAYRDADALTADSGSAHSAEIPAAMEGEVASEPEFSAQQHPVREAARPEGLVEEEEIDEEEYEFSHFLVDDDADFEEMEEETLAADGVEIGEAVRDAHLEERIRGGYEGEESAESDVETDGESEGEEAEGLHAEGEELSDEDAEFEGRAELRAPAEKAAFQQKTERAPHDRDRRFSRRRGGNRRQRGGAGLGRQQHRALPTISELLKEGQEILVQIAKEPIAKKGARITSHIALPGRYLVFMPTVNHVGVSRKIASEEERQRLKRILLSEKGATHGGFIVRTAAGGAGEEDLRADIRFLINLWLEIKNRSESSKSPALIYHDLNLVERILRDQVSANFSTVWVDNEQEYERVLRFLNRFQPSLVRRVKLYTKETPLFDQFSIQEEINKALKSKVWLKSGGYIVINQTEALVAIDVNTGKYVGKTTRLEDTIVKTNVDAIQEIVRQIRLRDLGGIIVIDFIDMDERKNRQRVMQALEEALKADRAPSKVLQFNDFGLVAITRKRVKQSLERTLSTQCNYCTGTGMVKSPTTVCNEIYTEVRKMARHLEGHDVLLRVNPEIVKALKANNGRWLTELEELARRTIIVKSDPALHMEQFDIH